MFLGTIDSVAQPVRNKEIIEACEIIERQAKVIYELETHCDPAGTVQEVVALRENQKGLMAEIARLKEKNDG